MYDNGRGVLKDDAEAVRWYRLAADQGDAFAQFESRVQVRQRARAFSRTMPKPCAGFGSLRIMVTPGRSLNLGRHVRQRARAFSRTMPKPCAGTSSLRIRVTPRAQFELGFRYANGKGVLKDDAEAVRWLRLAADQGDATAQLVLGLMYADGNGVLEDDAEAARWFRLAADQGDARAQFGLGVSYADGKGVLKDSVLAHMWLNIAGANGTEVAREKRDNLERDMTRAEISRATELARECRASDYQDCAP